MHGPTVRLATRMAAHRGQVTSIQRRYSSMPEKSPVQSWSRPVRMRTWSSPRPWIIEGSSLRAVVFSFASCARQRLTKDRRDADSARCTMRRANRLPGAVSTRVSLIVYDRASPMTWNTANANPTTPQELQNPGSTTAGVHSRRTKIAAIKSKSTMRSGTSRNHTSCRMRGDAHRGHEQRPSSGSWTRSTETRPVSETLIRSWSWIHRARKSMLERVARRSRSVACGSAAAAAAIEATSAAAVQKYTARRTVTTAPAPTSPTISLARP
ncbi:hypothetical protein DFJ74DRAFT_694276 [Hyaloraphidium curvatum]|nr:hypothetical protein DFJ74DRAFT_694276 [Hyaloraphidium curvatum]